MTAEMKCLLHSMYVMSSSLPTIPSHTKENYSSSHITAHHKHNNIADLRKRLCDNISGNLAVNAMPVEEPTEGRQ